MKSEQLLTIFDPATTYYYLRTIAKEEASESSRGPAIYPVRVICTDYTGINPALILRHAKQLRVFVMLEKDMPTNLFREFSEADDALTEWLDDQVRIRRGRKLMSEY